MSQYLLIIKAEWLMFLQEIKYYWINTVFYSITTLLLFLGIFYTFQQSDPTPDAIMSLLIGVLLWHVRTGALSYLTMAFEDEAKMGTLEQIMMSRGKITEIFLIKAFITVIFTSIKCLVFFVICAYIFGVAEHIFSYGLMWLAIAAIGVIGIIGFIGLGFGLAGLTLIYKRTQSLPGVLSYVFLFFSGTVVTIEALPPLIQHFAHILPITWTISVLRKIVVNHESIATIIAQKDTMYMIMANVGALIFGIIAFNVLVNKAKAMGKVGHY
ncbi:MAG: ABC transporter permease [Candidatus Sabulitectum sp.]|nr:ABC transporter permease [Candidatus Sabulitectum sp.]